MSLAWRVMVPVSGRGSSSCSVTVAEDAPLDSSAGHLRSCSDLHGSGCARIQRSCSCGTTGRRICRSRGVSAPLLPSKGLLRLIPRALFSYLLFLLYATYYNPYSLRRRVGSPLFFLLSRRDVLFNHDRRGGSV